MWRTRRIKQHSDHGHRRHAVPASGRLAFLRSNLQYILIWPFISFLVAAVGWVSLHAELEEERRAIEVRILRAAAAIARGYADQLTRSIQVVDQILLHVRYEWKLSNGNLQLENNKQTDLFPASPLFNVGIVSREGILLTNTVPAQQEIKVSDRRYFDVQREASEDRLYIGEAAIGRVSKHNVVQFSRRITDADGSFNGVVRASVAPEYLTASYDPVTLGDRGLMAIVGNDLAVRAARIGDVRADPNTIAIRKTALTSQQTQESLFAKANGSVLVPGDIWFADNRNRYIGWQQVPGFPLIALVGLDAEDAFAAYRAERRDVIQRALLSSVVLLAFTVVAMGLSARLAWRKHQMEATQAAYRLATEGGSEGFYICRPVLDSAARIIDFEITDCNQTAADFYRKTREDMLGARLSDLHPDEHDDWRERLLHHLKSAMEQGTLEDDVEMLRKGSRSRRWFHLKIARADGVLSITTQDVTKAKEHLLELERKGNEDALTGIPNRHWMTAYLPGALKRAANEQSGLALLFIDLDGFKAVNDVGGHDSGDELLRNVARRIKQAVRPGDHVVRIGGDEFVVILEQIAERDAIEHVAERILHAFDQKFRLSVGAFHIGTSIGISIFPDDGADADTLLTHADAAMYSVKTSGKHGYQFFDPLYFSRIRERQDKEAELRHAVEHDEFVMYYQPRVDVATGITCSMEALVRWAHPTKGIIGPQEFIPLAEETGLILRLGELVIDKVCAQLAFWLQSKKVLVPVSVNISAIQFNEAQIAEMLRAALLRHHVPASLVEIELTESSMTGDSLHIAQALKELQNLGVRLAVDDFGTGYSSLSQLQRLDFDVLKVDRAFTAELERTREGEIFFTAIITMAHALEMRVVAEGVETAEQAKKLKELRCDEIQGFYVSCPLPAAEYQPVLPRSLFSYPPL